MSSKEIAQTLKTVDLPTQQRRLRHLRSIAARNIIPRGLKDKQLLVTQLQSFYTLHTNQTSPAFYKSEIITGSLNPTWRSFSINHLVTNEEADIDPASKSLVVKVWQGEGGHHKECIQWHVHLSGLVYLGDRMLRDDISYAPNTLIFGMLDAFYGCPPNNNENEGRQYTRQGVMVEQAFVRDSYSTHTLSRIQTVLRAIKQTRSSVHRERRAIEDRLQQSQNKEKHKSACETRGLRVNMVREDLEWRMIQLQTLKDKYEVKQTANYHRDVALKNKFETLLKDKSRLHEKKKEYFDVREELIKTGAQLVMRRKQLISELAFIYPIVEIPGNIFTICGVKLPNSEDFAGQDEMMIAVALGYTTHLVQMISQFLDVPLRYPMEHRVSRSQVRDHIIDKLADKERDFPLYSKGKEKFQFNYGVYLLNKNIAQLRYYCGLGTTDLRLTLPNIKTLLELRLGVKFESGSPLGNLSSQLIPPNLGGPQKMTSPSFSQPMRGQEERSLVSKAEDNKSVSSSSDKKTDKSPQEDDPLNSKGRVIENGEDALSEKDALSLDSPDGFVKSPESTSLHEICEKTSHGEHKVLSSDRLLAVQSQIAGSLPLRKPTSQSMTGLEQITKQKLMGSIANYDDIEVSSSEDSANATYGSKFKHWPREDALRHQGITSSRSADELLNRGNLKDLTNQTDITTGNQSNAGTFKTKGLISNRDSSVNRSIEAAELDTGSELAIRAEYPSVADCDSELSEYPADTLSISSDMATFKLPYASKKPGIGDTDSDSRSEEILVLDS